MYDKVAMRRWNPLAKMSGKMAWKRSAVITHLKYLININLKVLKYNLRDTK